MAGCSYQFGVFTADPGTGELRKNGSRLRLQERPFQLLLALLVKSGEVVTREELRQRLWPDGTYVDFDHSISSAINKLRAALNDSATHPRYIETVGRRGYRFLADVKQITNGARAAQTGTSSAPVLSTLSNRTRRYALLGVAAAVALVLTFYFAWPRLRPHATPVAGKLMLGVLPFQNLTGDPSQDYFSDGLTEEMMTQLGRLDPQRLSVVALRTSVMHYQRTPEQLEQTARELGVQYLLQGSVRRESNKVRIDARLVQASDQTQVWARQYDRELRDLLTLQGEIANEVADEIPLALGQGKSFNVAGRQTALSPEEYEAYDLYLRGRYFWNKRTPESFDQAAQIFQQAIAKAPNYARGYAGLADAYVLQGTYYLLPQNEIMPKARAAALKSLELDPNLAEAHTTLALITEIYDYDWQSAEKEYRRAIELDPNYATAHQWYAEELGWEGRFDQALAESERARQLDPLSLIIASDDCAILYYARRYDRAIQECKSVLQMEPGFGRALFLLTSTYVQQGRFRDAMSLVSSPALSRDPWIWGNRAYIYGRAGRLAQARQAMVNMQIANRRWQLDLDPSLAVDYAATGDKEQSLIWLKKCLDEHAPPPDIKVNPAYDPLHGDPRFQELLRRIGLQ